MLTRQKQYEKIFSLWEEGSYQTDFYKKKLIQFGMQRIKVDCIENFKKLPFMTKDDLRNSKPSERTNCRQNEILSFFSSTGTTGEKTVYAFSKEDKRIQEYVTKNVYGPLGINSEDIGLVAVPINSGNMGHSMIWQYMVMGGGFYVCDISDIEYIRYALKELPVTTLSTLPSLAMLMDNSAEDRSIAASSAIKRLLVGGDALSPARRLALEKLYDAKCYNSFGMSEIFGPIANECEKQDGMHFCDDVLLIEVLNPDTLEEVEAGETGIAVYTVLWKKGSPLIRYMTDDLVSITEIKCSCGSSLPRLYHKGRLSFSRRTKSGKIITLYDIEQILFLYGYSSAYYMGEQTDGSYCLHIQQEMMNRVDDMGLKKNLSDLLESDCMIRYDCSNSYEYKNHCFRP